MVGVWTCWCYPVRKHAVMYALCESVLKLVKRTNQRHACRLQVTGQHPYPGPLCARQEVSRWART